MKNVVLDEIKKELNFREGILTIYNKDIITVGKSIVITEDDYKIMIKN